jgi:hypothetical protein
MLDQLNVSKTHCSSLAAWAAVAAAGRPELRQRSPPRPSLGLLGGGGGLQRAWQYARRLLLLSWRGATCVCAAGLLFPQEG